MELASSFACFERRHDYTFHMVTYSVSARSSNTEAGIEPTVHIFAIRCTISHKTKLNQKSNKKCYQKRKCPCPYQKVCLKRLVFATNRLLENLITRSNLLT